MVSNVTQYNNNNTLPSGVMTQAAVCPPFIELLSPHYISPVLYIVV